MTAVHRDGDDLILELQLQPRRGRDEVLGLHGEVLRIRVGAPPVDGAANERLCRFLAAEFRVPLRQVILETGLTGRRKRVRIHAPRQTPAWLPDAG